MESPHRFIPVAGKTIKSIIVNTTYQKSFRSLQNWVEHMSTLSNANGSKKFYMNTYHAFNRLSKVNSKLSVISSITGTINTDFGTLIRSSLFPRTELTELYGTHSIVTSSKQRNGFSEAYRMISDCIQSFVNRHARDDKHDTARRLVSTFSKNGLNALISSQYINLADATYLQRSLEWGLFKLCDLNKADINAHSWTLKILSRFSLMIYNRSNLKNSVTTFEQHGFTIVTESLLSDIISQLGSEDDVYDDMRSASSFINDATDIMIVLSYFVPPQGKVVLLASAEILKLVSQIMKVSADLGDIVNMASATNPDYDINEILNDFISSKSNAYFQGASAEMSIKSYKKGRVTGWHNFPASYRPLRVL